MKPISVKELAEKLNKAVAEGYGDYFLQVSDDEECNGYHLIFNNILTLGEDITYRDGNERKIGKTLYLD